MIAIKNELFTTPNPNLLTDGSSDEWSPWITINKDVNWSYGGSWKVTLDVALTDVYTNSVEIEAHIEKMSTGDWHGFLMQGSVDGKWDLSNGVNIALIKSFDIGTYKKRFIAQNSPTKEGTHTYNYYFCAYYISGEFRFRRLKMEKGSIATDWVPAVGGGRHNHHRTTALVINLTAVRERRVA